MAKLYGRMKNAYKSGAVEVTRTAETEIYSKLETWDGSIKTVLDKNGDFKVYIGSKGNPTTLIAKGNVNTNLSRSVDVG